MSLLDRANADILVFPEILVYDEDGNAQTKAAEVGIPARAMIQLKAQSGTSALRSEQDNEGFETEVMRRVRLTRESERRIGLIGAQAQIEYDGKRWSLFGDPALYNTSRRTRHYDYTIRRT